MSFSAKTAIRKSRNRMRNYSGQRLVVGGWSLAFSVLATAMMRGTALGWIGAGLIATGLFVKARMEEAFLRSELGDAQYRAYAHRVPMLVPFLTPRPMHQ